MYQVLQSAIGRELEAALTKLSKQLRALGSLPLKVVGVQPLSAAARHTAAFPPLPHPLIGGGASAANGSAGGKIGRVARCLEPVDVLVQLEGSGAMASHSNVCLCSRWLSELCHKYIGQYATGCVLLDL